MAISAAAAVVGKVLDYLSEPAKTLAKQCLCANKVSKQLDKEKKELMSELDDLLNMVEQAKQRAEEIEKSVNKWINNVENLLKEVTDLERRMTATTSCLNGKCPTLERYRLCKEMMKKIKALTEFKGKSNFKPLSHPAPLPGILYRQVSQTFTYFGATKAAIDQIMDALQDDDTYTIGVHGMGGSGKTTAAIEVGREAKTLGLFDNLIVIPISQNPNISNIQGYMADLLGVKLDEESEEGRAQRLWLTLKQKKKVLLIIDDLWKKRFNLQDIGIILGDHGDGKVKIIITTRDESVCTSMDCSKTIKLDLLSIDESWDLFKLCAGIDDKFSRLLDNVPSRICWECRGLPIAIKAVGSSLKGRPNVEWRDALQKLKNPNNIKDHVEGVGDVLNCLKLSYDILPCKREKELFLLCCMFGASHFQIEILIRYSVGLLNFGENDSLDSARNEVEACITRFLGSGLLTCYEEIIVGDTPEYLQVHDMFRNTGRWIAKHFEKNYNFFNVAKTLTTPIEKDILEDCFGVTSWYNDGVEKVDFLFHFDAPNLQIIALCGNFKSSPLLSFEGIKGLKVFDLSQFLNQNIVLTLPLSIKFLEDLRFLRLCNWELGDISCISSLTRLELLALNSSTINELPNDLDKLKRLKLLDLSYCRYREKNYNGAIGKCSQLEELYLNTLGSKPKEFYCQIVADIITLPKLQRFVIKYKSVQFTVSVDAVSKKKILELVDFDISKLRVSKKNLLQQAEIVVLERVHGGCPSIFPDMVGVVGAMNRLSHLHFGKCQEIECLLDTTSGFEVDLPNLVELVLYELANLKDLCRGPSIKVLRFLENLETVTIVGCCQLSTLFPRESKLKNLTHLTLIDFTGETLFSMSVAQSLQQLTELHVHKCVELKHIFASEGEGGSNEIVPISPQRSSQSTLMPKLKSFDLSKCVKLESAFPNCCVEGFAALESIIISEAPQLKLIFGELDHQNHSSHQCQSIHSHLKHLELNNLDNLIGICLEGNGARWPSLSEPLVNNCPKLTVYEEKNVENVKALLEFETSVPLQQQQILFNGNEVSNSQKLVLTMTVSSGAGAAASSEFTKYVSFNADGSVANPSDFLEVFRLDSNLMGQLFRNDLELARVILGYDLDKLQEILRLRHRQRDQLRRQKEEMALLYADPFDVEAQNKIEAAIRQKGIDENWEAALEHNPEAFARVVKLYVDMEVNGVPMKAFVDSGAQSAIISKSCAERLGLLRLLDQPYKGVAHGVGQTEILGQRHVAPIKIGNPCSFLVLDSPNLEFLFGLDMLRKHQCIIDLKENVLLVGGGEVSVPFLQEKDIPSWYLDEEKYSEEASSSGSPRPVASGSNNPSHTDSGDYGDLTVNERRINENWEAALKHNPEAFARVVMLYVDMEVNGVSMKAFVHSGAQSTIISKSCAERLGLLSLLDKRYRGVAHGVGQTEILGRIHVAPINIGNIFYPCSFLVLDSANMEFLFGLDMLRKHQCIIDLKENVLRVGGGEVSVPFLQEKDIPSRYLDDEKYSKEASSSVSPRPAASGSNSLSQAGASSGGASGDKSKDSVFESKVAKLVELGFDRQAVIQALQLFNGNDEQAVGFLFG